MPRDWNTFAENTEGKYEVNDFKHAMYQLVVQQCLYLRQRDQAVAFRLISAHRAAFTEAVALMGLRLAFNDRLEYCYVAQDSGPQGTMDLQETLFLLTLRHVYHTRASDHSPEGDLLIDISEFEESYKSLCHRAFEGRADTLRALLKMASRHGVARAVEALEGDPQPFAITILPGIADVLSEHALNRFGADLKARLVLTDAVPVRQEEAS
ncbi:MAG: DUF4194 domain-containing protein [Ramlibacter sp.]|nr:DUF4194 domain-containing protein [Ramlibacter sp.]